MTDHRNKTASEPEQADARERPLQLIYPFLGFLLAMPALSIDIYLPAMPTMTGLLNAPLGSVEWTVSGFLLGFVFGQFIWGGISDRYGRKRPLVVGLVLFAIGSAACASANNIWFIIGARVLQAVGASSAVVIGRAIVRDLFDGDRVAVVMSMLMAIVTVGPIFAPLLGSQILHLFGWRANFWVLLIYAFAMLVALYFFEESLPHTRRRKHSLMTAVKGLGTAFGGLKIALYTVTGGFFYLGLFAYISGTPNVYIGYFKLPDQYFGVLFAIGGIGILLSNFVNARYVPRVGLDRMMLAGAGCATLSGIVVALAAATGVGGLTLLASAIFCFVSSSGLIVGNSISGALNYDKERAGAISASMGAVQFAFGGVSSFALGVFADGTPLALGLTICASGICCLICAFLLQDGRVTAGTT